MPRDSATVSNNMRKIHSKDTAIELLLRKALWHKGYRYRKNYKALPGSPDIVLTKYKIAIFCDSEFFHGKDWEILKLRLEKGKNPDFWVKKIERNRNRDYENDKKLLFLAINEQISNFAQTYPTNLKASSNEALLFMRRYRFANCSCFSCCFKDAYPSSNVQ